MLLIIGGYRLGIIRFNAFNFNLIFFGLDTFYSYTIIRNGLLLILQFGRRFVGLLEVLLFYSVIPIQKNVVLFVFELF